MHFSIVFSICLKFSPGGRSPPLIVAFPESKMAAKMAEIVSENLPMIIISILYALEW